MSETFVELSVHPDVLLDPPALRREAIKVAKLRDRDVYGVRVVRRAIDARRGRVRIQLRIALELSPRATSAPPISPVLLPHATGEPQVAIVGMGPAGLFCAWALAQAQIPCVVIERGKKVQPRRHDLARLTRDGVVDPDSNYCFGEGGAGTFSDGKLYTRADKRGDPATILQALVGYGAPADIMVDARPHIGTNRLPGLITSMREHLESAGVRFHFECRADGLLLHGNTVAGLALSTAETLPVRAVVLAPGHSARDVQRWLREAGVAMTFKPFAVGVRVEHPQALIDKLQYGSAAGHPVLGAASYRLVEQPCGLGVFSFCMCPGGFMVPAATNPGEQVVNGWSPSSRRGRFANSGFVVEVAAPYLISQGHNPDDPLAGVALQSRLERLAYELGGGAFIAPAQRLDDFVAKRASTELPDCSYPRGIVPVELDEILGNLAPALREALRRVGDRMPGFCGPEAVAVALESRTSCPMRVLRGDDGQSVSHPGLYPCGEGTGHAGGIMSAALDGLRTARSIVQSLRPRAAGETHTLS